MTSNHAEPSIAREEVGVVLVVRAPDALSPDGASLLREALDDLSPDGWWFLNPGTFIAVFLDSKGGAERSERAQAAIHRLVSESPLLADVAIGGAEGRLLCAFGSGGVLQSLPLGQTVNAALTEALRNAG